MDNINKSIIENIKSGQYFADAKEWYVVKYVNPVIELFILIFSLLWVSFALLLAYYFFESINNVTNEVTFTHISDDINKTYAVIKPISSDKEDPDISLGQYMVKQYVTRRELYNYSKAKQQFDFVKNHSSVEILKEYMQLISINNPQSPFLLYQDRTTRTIKIQKISPVPKEQNSYIVKFLANIYSKNDNINENSLWEAQISYYLSPLKSLIEKNSDKLDFIVTKYSVKKID